ncbi:MAG: hypothetical protein MNSN_10820 [Minisyncoccus archaeiphilus]|uniref:hypothetical protein n=1 Tax=Minisyncoccus archaeiphilus TaxID=3238481 RepID=UPI002B0BD82B|nr:MAG: hypothetical protein MNSN_10820 [Candidatus Parcubacteria bacterium]
MTKLLSILLISLFAFTSLVSAEEVVIDEVSLEEVSVVSNDAVIDPGYYACISLAISTREDAYIARWNNYSSSLASAYATRKTGLVSAWASADKETVKKGVNDAAKAFKDSLLEAKKKWIESEKEIVSKMKADKEECQSKYGIVPPTNQNKILPNAGPRAALMKQIQEMLQKRGNSANKPIRLNAK